MTGTIFLGGTARRKSSGAEARFAGACQDQHAGRSAPSLGWPGERKSIGATSRGKRRFSKISWCGFEPHSCHSFLMRHEPANGTGVFHYCWKGKAQHSRAVA